MIGNGGTLRSVGWIMPNTYNALISRRMFMAAGSGLVAYAAIPKEAHALAFVCANCSTIVQQMLEYGQQVYSVGVQVQQYRTQLLQWSNMIQNTIRLPMNIWNDVANDIVRLRNLANIGSLLRGPGGGILGMLSSFDSAASEALSVADMVNKYNAWGQVAGQNITTMQQAMGLAGDQMTSDAMLLSAIQAQSDNATGQVQVLQAANEMASLTFSNIQGMHTTLMAHAQQVAAYDAAQSQRQAMQDQATIRFLSSPPAPMTGGTRY